MKTWNDYKEHVKAVDPEAKKDIEEIESLSAIITSVTAQRNALTLSQKDFSRLNKSL